jgi:hypothetical protein
VWVARHFERPLAVAAQLEQGALGGGYAEACLLLFGVVSGLSAAAWPGKKKDRKRFIELLVRHGNAPPSAARISAPLLCADLRRTGKVAEAVVLEGLRPRALGRANNGTILTEADVDMEEAEVRSACPALAVTDIRSFSYGSLVYGELRCAFVHEYQFGERATSRPMTDRPAGVSYSNSIEFISADLPAKVRHGQRESRSWREIVFHYKWLEALTRSCVTSLDAIESRLPLAGPPCWWIDGG